MTAKSATNKNSQHWQRIALAEARRISMIPHVLIWWRPEAQLPEVQQYAMVHMIMRASTKAKVRAAGASI